MSSRPHANQVDHTLLIQEVKLVTAAAELSGRID